MLFNASFVNLPVSYEVLFEILHKNYTIYEFTLSLDEKNRIYDSKLEYS